MIINEETIKNIYNFANLLYSPREVAVRMKIDFVEFKKEVENPDSKVYDAYWSGFYQRDAELRSDVARLSNLGSSPAQAMMDKWAREAKMNQLDK